MKTISIIVPVYNIQNYIDKCIQSILSQNYTDYELILVDDGSTDNSGKICDKYLINEHVKVYHKKNGGLSDARNYGIEKSNGKYLMFIDGDDFLYNNECLEKLNDCIDKNNADVIQYKMVYYYDRNDKLIFQKNLEKLDGSVIENLSLLNSNGQVSVSACDKIVKSEIIKDKNLYFEKGLLSEDLKWSYIVYLNINNIESLNENIYVYRQQRLNSISTIKGKKNVHDLYEIIKYWLNYEYENDTQKHLYYNMISYWYLILRVKYNNKYYSDDMRIYFKKMDKEILLYHNNCKVNKAYKLSKILGYRLTIYAMKTYIFLKNKGIVKL